MARNPHPSELPEDEYQAYRLPPDVELPGRLGEMRAKFGVVDHSADRLRYALAVKPPRTRPPFDWLNRIVLPFLGAALLFAGWHYGWLSFDVIKDVILHD